MPAAYTLTDAPRHADMIAFDCADCGHPELGRPVFLAGPSGTIAVGTGCAARLLGLPVAEVAADVATARLLALVETAPVVREVWTWLRLTRPGRITAKYTAETADRYRSITADTLAEVLDAYRVLGKVDRVDSVKF